MKTAYLTHVFFIYCSLLLGDFCTENIMKKDWLSTEQTLNETLAKKHPGGTFLQIQTDIYI